MARIEKNKIIWDAQDWLGGLDQTSPTTYNKKGTGIADAQRIDPLRNVGYISPGFDSVDLTNYTSVTGFLLNGIVDGAIAYAISDDAKIHSISSLNTGVISTTAPYPKTITGASSSGQNGDIVTYYVNVSSTRSKRHFYSWKDGSNGNVGIIIPGSPDTFDDDWLSTVPASAATLDTTNPHPLIVGDDDILYIGDGNNVHAMDGATGTDGTLYKNVLTLPKGWVITSFAKTNDFKLAVAAYYTSSSSGSTFNKGEAKVYLWDYLSLDPSYIYNLNDNYVSEILNWKGTLIAFTQGRQTFSEPNINKLQVLTGTVFEVLKTWQYGTVPRRGGVDIINDDIIWNAGGRVYTYAKVPGVGNYILNSNFGNSTGADSSGMLRIFSSAMNIIYSSGSTSGKAAVRATSGTFNGSPAVLNLKTVYPLLNVNNKARMTRVTLKLLAATTDANGAQMALLFYTDKTNSVYIIYFDPTLAEQTIYYQTTDINGTAGNLPAFTSISPEIQWQAGSDNTKCPIIESIIVDFEEIAQQL